MSRMAGPRGVSDRAGKELRGGVSPGTTEAGDWTRHWGDETPPSPLGSLGQEGRAPQTLLGAGGRRSVAGGGRRRRPLVGTRGAAGAGGGGDGAGGGCWPEHLLPGGSHSAWPLPPHEVTPMPGRATPFGAPIGPALKPGPRPSGLATPLPAAESCTRVPQAAGRTRGSSKPSPLLTLNERLLSTYCVPGPVPSKHVTDVIAFNPQSDQLCELHLLSLFYR